MLNIALYGIPISLEWKYKGNSIYLLHFYTTNMKVKYRHDKADLVFPVIFSLFSIMNLGTGFMKYM